VYLVSFVFRLFPVIYERATWTKGFSGLDDDYILVPER
jgi:hypothetical protein